jgi:pimeloyl-ACP methyl ester carboxylesterase
MNKVHYRTAHVSGLEIFYREAGEPGAPTILLLHGFPTSSHMFRDLIPRLADRYHLVAPDYPGFGYSACPEVGAFRYTFDHLTDVIEAFTGQLQLERYALYLQDFGGPVGFRLAVRRPQQVRALLLQNANAYQAGMTAQIHDWLLALSQDRSAAGRAQATPVFELPYTRRQYLEGVADPDLVSPDAWWHAQWGMDRPGNKDIQYELHANYASNFERYAEWQAYFRKHQPPALVMWGAGDFVFGVPGARAYQQDLKDCELHILEGAAHFALETHGSEIAALVREFLGRRL